MNHHHDTESNLSFEEKLVKILEHWLKHNIDHAETYKDWADKAREKGLNEAASLIENAADITAGLNEKFESAIDSVKNKS